MWDLIVSVPVHCLSFYFSAEAAPNNRSRISSQYSVHESPEHLIFI